MVVSGGRGCSSRRRRRRCFRFFHDHEPSLDDAARVDSGSPRAQALRRRRRAGQRVALGGGRRRGRSLVLAAVVAVRREARDDVAVVGPRAVPEPQDAVASSRDQRARSRGEQRADGAAGARRDAGRGEVGREWRRRRRRRRSRRRRRRKPSQRHGYRPRSRAGRTRPQHEPGRPPGDLPQRGLPSRCAPDQRARGRRQR